MGVVPAPGDVATTTNLVNSTPTATTSTTTWQNIGLWNQGLPCWSPQDAAYGAYCGPQPYFNQGSFNFSYGVTDVNQTVNIAAALPNSGTGLRVTGYMFGFTAKNGNGWDGAGLDTLWAYVRLTGADGKTLENDVYNLNYQFDWTPFNISRNYTTPYVTRDLSTVTYGFIGGDTSNYWAGPYGPEIYNVSFRLRYDVDPCTYNPLSSPSCPGWADAMKKITDSATAGTTASEPTVTAIATAASSPATTASTAQPTTASTTQPTTAASAPTVINPVAVLEPVATTNPVRSVAPLSTAAVLNNIRRTESQLQSTVSSTVQTSIQTSIEAGAAALQQAQQDAGRSQQDSQRQAEAAAQSPATTITTTATAAATPAPNIPIATASTSVTQINLGSGISFSTSSIAAQNSGADTVSSVSQINMAGPLMSAASIVNTASAARSADTANNASDVPAQDTPLASFSRPGDPTQAARTGTLVPPPAEISAPTGSSVRNTAPPTQLAGGADFAAMSRSTDITSYTGIRLTDAAFYQPREIYRGQRVVDNARVLRGLGSDRLHQQMIDQQYNRGN